MARITIDLEPTNRCNAHCTFCPRDRTPHQGLMTREVFDRALARAIELRADATSIYGSSTVEMTLCGLGEPLLHPLAPTFVRDIVDAGFRCALSTNASRLDEATGAALLDAGLGVIWVNAGERDAAYESVYGLPFAETCDNVVRFAQRASGRCTVVLVLVGPHGDGARARALEDFWRARGIHRFAHHELINRGGSLATVALPDPDHWHDADELLRGAAVPFCGVPFRFAFVGYDGNYYLCSSDWEKRVALGSVFDASFVDVMPAKLEHVTSRSPLCHACSLDPRNQVATRLAARDGSALSEVGGARGLVTDILAGQAQARALVDPVLGGSRAPITYPGIVEPAAAARSSAPSSGRM